VIGFGARWLAPLRRPSSASDDGCHERTRNEHAPGRQVGLAAQAASLLDVVEGMQGRILTPDEADAVATLTAAIWALVGGDEDAHEDETQP
jgi:hypothetical protein